MNQYAFVTKYSITYFLCEPSTLGLILGFLPQIISIGILFDLDTMYKLEGINSNSYDIEDIECPCSNICMI
jgi:hypothetical protein